MDQNCARLVTSTLSVSFHGLQLYHITDSDNDGGLDFLEFVYMMHMWSKYVNQVPPALPPLRNQRMH